MVHIATVLCEKSDQTHNLGFYVKSMLRGYLRHKGTTFKKLEDYPPYVPVHNYDGLIFGVKDKWRGILHYIPYADNDVDRVEISIKGFDLYRVKKEDLDFIVNLIRDALNGLKDKEDCIKEVITYE